MIEVHRPKYIKTEDIIEYCEWLKDQYEGNKQVSDVLLSVIGEVTTKAVECVELGLDYWMKYYDVSVKEWRTEDGEVVRNSFRIEAKG